MSEKTEDQPSTQAVAERPIVTNNGVMPPSPSPLTQTNYNVLGYVGLVVLGVLALTLLVLPFWLNPFVPIDLQNSKDHPFIGILIASIAAWILGYLATVLYVFYVVFNAIETQRKREHELKIEDAARQERKEVRIQTKTGASPTPTPKSKQEKLVDLYKEGAELAEKLKQENIHLGEEGKLFTEKKLPDPLQNALQELLLKVLGMKENDINQKV